MIRPAVDTLQQCLGDADESTRSEAMLALRELCKHHAELFVPIADDLRGVLDDDNTWIRERALIVLGEIAAGRPEAIDPPFDDFEACLADDVPNVRSKAILRLGSIAETYPDADRLSIDDFRACLDDDSWTVCSSATTALASLAETHPETVRPVIDDILELLSPSVEFIGSGPGGEQIHIMLALGRLGVTYPREAPRIVSVLQRIFDEDPWVRMEATEALLAIDAVDPEAATAAEGICALLLADDESTEAIERFVAAKPAVRALVITELRSRVGDMDSVDEKPTVAAAFRTISTIDDAYLHLS
ncbi:hypothetical protein C485_00440 [Natrinema altunense JCM 12890]|uniref:Clathrin/coatomer adaptor adaptin-like N-terminal domain-containing protein n=1 Tax=Natrinema altunense (strain JCM 12890 / CGMCC 1.3731 / AJ2) TaxID=1227494 RepID=L9ZZL5_NATA2|nr:hypothetical protein C485_00440 [Natrinema altunense JCM 12890]